MTTRILRVFLLSRPMTNRSSWNNGASVSHNAATIRTAAPTHLPPRLSKVSFPRGDRLCRRHVNEATARDIRHLEIRFRVDECLQLKHTTAPAVNSASPHRHSSFAYILGEGIKPVRHILACVRYNGSSQVACKRAVSAIVRANRRTCSEQAHHSPQQPAAPTSPKRG